MTARGGLFLLILISLGPNLHAARFIRGDVDANGTLNISDVITLIFNQFGQGARRIKLSCDDAADFDDDGAINIRDVIGNLLQQFANGPPPKSPYPDCGFDLTVDDLTCESFDFCPQLPNSPPELASIGNKTVAELTELSFTATATDADSPQNALTFSLDPGAPPGAQIDSQSGEFTWRPDESQGPADHEVTVRVTDDGSLSDSETITVTVDEVNRPPVLDPIGDRIPEFGKELVVDVTASDPDEPAQDLTFSLDAGAPAGASIDPKTGQLRWLPFGAFPFDVTVRVTDNGSPSLDDFETFQIGGIAGADTVSYEYDAAGRLVRASYESGVTISYEYDAAGNLLSTVTAQP